jgi:hypothetical protein
MSEYVIPPPEPKEIDEKVSLELRPDRPGSDADRVRADLTELSKLVEAGIEVDGEVQVDVSTWVVYGRTSYDGEIIVGEYHDAREAFEVLRAAPRSHDHDGPAE